MISDPFAEFRRAAASYLARMEARLVEEALSIPGRMVDSAGRAIKGAVVDEVRRAAALIKMLIQLPHYLADMLADSMRGPNARPLTARERLVIGQVFGNRARPNLIRVVNSAGRSPIAASAFKNGNPATTVGNTIYLRPESKWPPRDLTTTRDGSGTELLVHETTHTIQYRELGYAAFLGRYGGDMATAKGDANEMYRYWKRHRSFNNEMLEGQAEIVGNYYTYRNSTDPKKAALRANLRQRLQGTGYYGL